MILNVIIVDTMTDDYNNLIGFKVKIVKNNEEVSHLPVVRVTLYKFVQLNMNVVGVLTEEEANKQTWTIKQ
jgi:hypothetical protein